MSEDLPHQFESRYRRIAVPYGFSMYDPAATAALEKASRAAQDILRAHGFERILPAAIDYPDTFAENHEEMFIFKDNSGEKLALRNDITAQVIKGYVRQRQDSQNSTLRKFYYAAPVYKDVRRNYPLPREIWQIGCEIIGTGADTHLADLIALCLQILHSVFGYTTATEICDVRPHNAFAQVLGEDFLAAAHRRDAPLLANLLQEHFGAETREAQQLARWLFYPPLDAQKPQSFAKLPATLRESLAAAEDATAPLLQKLRAESKNAFWQPLAMPRSSYYSGIFFEVYAAGLTEPVARGGVYNELVRRYAPFAAGACGFAFDLLPFAGPGDR